MNGRLLIFIVSTIAFILLAIHVTPGFLASGGGTLVIKIKDPPEAWGEAAAVYITSTTIRVHRAEMGDASGWVDTGIRVTNLSLGETVFESAERQVVLNVGTYNLVRFELVQAIVTVNGQNYSCNLAREELTVSIVGEGVQVVHNGLATLLIDINPRITGTQGIYEFVPAVTARSS